MGRPHTERKAVAMTQTLVHRPHKSAAIVLKNMEAAFPALQGQLLENGQIRVSVKGHTPYIWVDYYEVGSPGGSDPWRYSLSHATAKTEYPGTFSHPTEQGCWIMARKYFAENGLLPVPEDNAHLSEKSYDIYLAAETRRMNRGLNAQHPETGDFIRDNQGNLRRVCHCYDDRCQTTTALERSYSTNASGYAAYSGSLGSSVAYTDLRRDNKTQPAMFWIFRDGIAGAGRAVEIRMYVQIWEYSGVFGNGLWWDRK